MILYVAAGGALGSMARYGVSEMVSRLAGGSQFPYGILSVNLLGGFFIGLLTGLMAHHISLSPEARAFLVVGVLGGFTTFSAFSLDIVLLMQRGQNFAALFYIMGSVVGAVFALVGGMALARAFA